MPKKKKSAKKRSETKKKEVMSKDEPMLETGFEGYTPPPPARRLNQTFRFYLKDDEAPKIIFLDDDAGARFFAHTVKWDERDNFDNTLKNMTFVCRSQTFTPNVKKCPLCASDDFDRTYIVAFTVLDFRGYETQDGEKKRFAKKLMLAKPKSAEHVRYQWKKRGGLRGNVYEVTRTDNRAPGTGDHFEFEGKKDLKTFFRKFKRSEKLEDDFIEPINYKKEFKILSKEELEQIADNEVPESLLADLEDNSAKEVKKGKKTKKEEINDDESEDIFDNDDEDEEDTEDSDWEEDDEDDDDDDDGEGEIPY